MQKIKTWHDGSRWHGTLWCAWARWSVFWLALRREAIFSSCTLRGEKWPNCCKEVTIQLTNQRTAVGLPSSIVQFRSGRYPKQMVTKLARYKSLFKGPFAAFDNGNTPYLNKPNWTIELVGNRAYYSQSEENNLHPVTTERHHTSAPDSGSFITIRWRLPATLHRKYS